MARYKVKDEDSRMDKLYQIFNLMEDLGVTITAGGSEVGVQFDNDDTEFLLKDVENDSRVYQFPPTEFKLVFYKDE